jgi:RNA polymerase sigma factor (sigma-70 family)
MAFLRIQKNFGELNDAQLLAEIREKGSSEAIGVLFERYAHLLYGVCLKVLQDQEASRDAVMDIWAELPAKIQRSEIQVLRNWLWSVARNHCLMELRKRQKLGERQTLILDSAMENPAVSHLMDKNLQEESLEIQLVGLENCLETLKVEQRDCVRMFYQEEKSYKDIEHLMGLSFKEVKSYIQNGKRNLKLCLESKNGRAE